MLTPLYQPTDEPMRVVGLMSGSGTNLQKILEHQEQLQQERGIAPYQVVAIFSDNAQSKATAIGRAWDLPVLTRDIDSFYQKHGMVKTMKTEEGRMLRIEFDSDTTAALRPYGASVAAYAGYMSAASSVLVNAYLGINVHPADLTILDAQGERKYRGDKAVRKALLAREQELRSSTHVIAEEVDKGPVLMVSASLPVELPASFDYENDTLVNTIADAYQSLLKEVGDWKIFPLTLQCLAEGRFAKDETGLLHFDGKPIPNGVRR